MEPTRRPQRGHPGHNRKRVKRRTLGHCSATGSIPINVYSHIPLENLYSPRSKARSHPSVLATSALTRSHTWTFWLRLLGESEYQISPAFWRLLCVPDISELTTPMPGSSCTRLGATLLETLAMGTLTMSPCRWWSHNSTPNPLGFRFPNQIWWSFVNLTTQEDLTRSYNTHACTHLPAEVIPVGEVFRR